jgi:hypothetical protein
VQQHSQHCKHLLCLPKNSLTWQLPANALHEQVCKGKLNVNVIAVGNSTKPASALTCRTGHQDGEKNCNTASATLSNKMNLGKEVNSAAT